jgi:hypothetical protein
MGGECMEEAIRRIIEIEHEAQNLVSEGLSQKEKIALDTQLELRVMETNILEMAEHKIEQLKSKNRKDADDKIIRIYENTALKMRLMEELFEEKQEQWENEIFNRVVGR